MSVAKNLVAGHILPESVVWMVAHYIDSGSEDYSVEAAISKVFASEALQRSAYEALQIAAGSGFMRDYPYEQITRDKIFTSMPQLLRGPAGIYEKYTVELAKASDFLLRKYGKSIADRQHELKRVADIAIDLFVGLCVLSRAATLSATQGENGAQAVAIARVFAQQAKRRMANNIRRAERNEDEEMNHLAGFILDRGSYPWDVVI